MRELVDEPVYRPRLDALIFEPSPGDLDAVAARDRMVARMRRAWRENGSARALVDALDDLAVRCLRELGGNAVGRPKHEAFDQFVFDVGTAYERATGRRLAGGTSSA